jgi:hypothetical protein
MKLGVTLTVIMAVVLVLLVSPSSPAGESDADQVVVSSQSTPFAGDVRSGRRHEVRYHALTIENRGNRPLALAGVRGRNGEVFVVDGLVSFTTAFSAVQGWSTDGPREFYRLIAPGSAIALTVAQRAVTDEGSATALGEGSLELLFADGSLLAI